MEAKQGMVKQEKAAGKWRLIGPIVMYKLQRDGCERARHGPGRLHGLGAEEDPPRSGGGAGSGSAEERRRRRQWSGGGAEERRIRSGGEDPPRKEDCADGGTGTARSWRSLLGVVGGDGGDGHDAVVEGDEVGEAVDDGLGHAVKGAVAQRAQLLQNRAVGDGHAVADEVARPCGWARIFSLALRGDGSLASSGSLRRLPELKTFTVAKPLAVRVPKSQFPTSVR